MMFVKLLVTVIVVTIQVMAEMDNYTNFSSPFAIHNITINKSLEFNDTVDANSTSTKTSFLLYDYLIPSIGTLIIVLNLVVVISSGLILKKGQQPRSTYLFLGNVAMTDLVTGVAVIFGQTFPKDRRDHYLCAVQLGMIVSSTLTSVYSVGLIAVDRFLYILYGMQYQRWVYPNRARSLIGISWAIGLLTGFLPLMGWYGDTNNGKICWFILLAPKQLVLLTVLLGTIPLLIVVLLYSVILYHAIKKIIQLQQQSRNSSDPSRENISTGNIRMFRGGGNSSENEETPQEEEKGILRFLKKKPSQSVKAPNKWKAIKVVLFTTGSFVITWCPYFITSLIYVFSCDTDDGNKKCKTMRTLIASPLAILGFLNSFFNPIIYAWWHKGFRTFFKKKVNSMMMRRTNMNISESQSKSTSSKTVSTDNKSKMTSSSKSNLDAS